MVVRHVGYDISKVPSSRNVHVVCFRGKSSLPFATVTSWLFYNNVTLVQQALFHHNRYDHCRQDDYWLCCCKCQAYIHEPHVFIFPRKTSMFFLFRSFSRLSRPFFVLTRCDETCVWQSSQNFSPPFSCFIYLFFIAFFLSLRLTSLTSHVRFATDSYISTCYREHDFVLTFALCFVAWVKYTRNSNHHDP